jgi:uncharacterized lipoprotein YehR (DUF1307 family)
MHISILKKNKIIFMLCLSFLLTGCQVDYNLELEDVVKEEININVSSNMYEVEDRLNVLTPVLDVYEEGHNYTKTKNGNKLTYTYTYDNDKFSDSALTDACFEDFNFIDNDEYYSITAKGKFGCLYDNEKINLNVITSKYVSEHNGKKNKNTYTWTIDKNNRDNVDIEILVMKNKVVNEPTLSEMIKRIFKALVVLFMIVGGIIVYLRMEKENS